MSTEAEAASGKCCIDPAGPTAGKRTSPGVMEGVRRTVPSHHRISGLLFSCGSPAPCPAVLQCLSYIQRCPEKDPGVCEQNRRQHGLSLQGPLLSTEAPTVISFNIIGVTITSVKNQNLLGLNMLCKCSCLPGPSSGKLTVLCQPGKEV